MIGAAIVGAIILIVAAMFVLRSANRPSGEQTLPSATAARLPPMPCHPADRHPMAAAAKPCQRRRPPRQRPRRLPGGGDSPCRHTSYAGPDGDTVPTATRSNPHALATPRRRPPIRPAADLHADRTPPPPANPDTGYRLSPFQGMWEALGSGAGLLGYPTGPAVADRNYASNISSVGSCFGAIAHPA